METIIKEKVPTPTPEIVTEEPEFELDDKDTKILLLRPRYRKGKHEDEQFNRFVDMVCRLSINMPALGCSTSSDVFSLLQRHHGKQARDTAKHCQANRGMQRGNR